MSFELLQVTMYNRLTVREVKEHGAGTTAELVRCLQCYPTTHSHILRIYIIARLLNRGQYLKHYLLQFSRDQTKPSINVTLTKKN